MRPTEGKRPQVRFLAHGRGYGLFLTTKGAILSLRKPAAKGEAAKTEAQETILRMTLKGANTQAPITGLMPLPGKVNYLRGQDPKKWHTNIATYAKVKYEKVYPRIDVLYYGRQHQLKYDFIIAPGANPQTIQLTFTGAKDLRIDNRGQLVLATAAGEVYLRKPILYQQEARGAKQVVDGGYVRQGPHQVGFQVGAYDTNRPLVIDPILSYATYLGGDDYEEGNGIAVDSFGQVYVTGKTYSSDFPTTSNALQPTANSNNDAFIAKFGFSQPNPNSRANALRQN